ncbi:hypothetical protein B0H19DRAFT_1082112 [Mycena capillaripes]|nr:hypothetical protein B0H19DRAFT_1082112 [Mycena capillaripes]
MARSQKLIFLGLNAVRVLSIVALLLVFSSSILVMVTNIKAVNHFQANRIANSTDIMLDCDYIDGSTVPNQPAGVFWAVVASLLIIFQVIILLRTRSLLSCLITADVRWPAVFFDRFFPVLGSDFGLGALGIFQCLIGAQILSHHVDDFTLVSAFFLFSIGCLNMLLGLIFREGAKSKRSLRAKRDAKGIIATGPQFDTASPQFVNNVFGPEKTDNMSFASWKSTDKANYGFGRQGEKAAGLRGFMIQRPEETLPRYASPTPTYAAAPPSRELSPTRAPSTRAPSNRQPSPARSDSSRSSSSSRSSTYSESSSSSFASPMSYRETIQIPDTPRPETPPQFHASSPSRYGRNPGAF